MHKDRHTFKSTFQMDLLLEINDFVLCLGVEKAAEQGVLHAHLFCLNDPICLITRRWQLGEEFITGRWYKKNKSKKYELIDDIVRTMVVQKMDLTGNSQKTILELILPVFFPPDLSSLKQYCQVPVLHNRSALTIPICPLFGSHNVEYFPPVCWDQEQICMYSDQLYALKINLSFNIGSLPQWTHLNTNQLKPWDYEEYQIVKQLCMEARVEGLLLDGICPVHDMKNSPTICFMLNEQAELAISICDDAKRKGSEFREYWPIRLGIYEFPVIIALDCPQSNHHNFNNDLILRKLTSTNLLFEIVYTGRENVLENLTNFPWLGFITDQFYYLLDARVKDQTFAAIQAIMVFSLEKRSVAWVIVGIKDQGTFEMGDKLLNDGKEDKSYLQNSKQLEVIGSDYNPRQEIVEHSPQEVLDRKMVGRNVNPNLQYYKPAKWPKHWAIIIVQNAITPNISKEFIKRFTQTARQRGLAYCSTQSPNQVHWDQWGESGLEFVEEKFKYFKRMNCRFVLFFANEKGEIHHVTKLMEERYKVVTQHIGQDMAKKASGCIHGVPSQIVIENILLETNMKLGGINYSLKTNRNSVNPSNLNQNTTATHSVAPKKVDIAVFMTIRFGGNGDAVFLFWDTKVEKFTRKCYAQFHKSLNFNVEFGKWFELKYFELPDSYYQIIVFDFKETRSYAVTRVRDDVCAQFSIHLERFISVWHTTFPCEEKNNYVQDEGWWPWLCRKCFPSLRELSPPIVEAKEEQKVKEELTGSLEDLANRMRSSLVLEEERNALSIKKKPFFESYGIRLITKVLAVLFTIRDTNGDAVFLIYNSTINLFTHRIYGNPPEKIIGYPLIGRWYWMKYKSDIVLKDGHTINVIGVENLIGEPPVETRIKYGLAQFNTRKRLINTWHGSVQHKRSNRMESYDHPWWPNICHYCYPNADKIEAPTVKKEEDNNAMVKSTSWTTKNAGDKFTETSDSETEEEEMSTISERINSNYSKDGSGTSQMSKNANINSSFTPISTTTVNFLTPLISAVGNIFGPANSRSLSAISGTSMSNLNGNNINGQQNILPNSSATIRSVQNGVSKSSDDSQPSKLTGGFGMSQPRRHQQMLANSTFIRSNSPPIANGPKIKQKAYEEKRRIKEEFE